MAASLFALLLLPTGLAYPPAPHHLIYGLVRDEAGNPVDTEDAVVVLETSAGARMTAPILAGIEPGLNYKLPVPMDSGLTDDLYQPTALRPTLPFRLRVRVGQTLFLPIEMKGDYSQIGAPGGRSRIDLTLGEDTDGDGLPDAWERALMAASGGELTKLTDVHPEDDFDADGLPNLMEYLVGTYAFESRDGFFLKAIATEGGPPRLEFLAIRGRSYSLHGSEDFQTWKLLPFRVVPDGKADPALERYQATDVRRIQIEVYRGEIEPAARFYKLMVQ